MENSFKFSFILLSVLIFRATSIIRIRSYVSANSTIFSSNIGTSMVTNNGQTMYVTQLKTNMTIVDMYNINIATGTTAYVQSYADSQYQMNFNRLFVFENYLISYSTNNIIIDMFDISSTILFQNFTINQYVDKFYHATSKAIVLYLTIDGKLGYIPNASFGNSFNQSFLIDQNFSSSSSNVVFSVSKDQNYVALSGIINSSSLVYVYNLTSYSIVCQYSLPIGSAGDMDWMTDNEILLISTLKSGYIIKLNITSCSGSLQTINVYQFYKIIKMIYYSLTNQAIFTGISIANPNVQAVYSVNMDTNYVTYFKNYSTNSSWISFNYQSDNQNFFTIALTNYVKVYQIIPNCLAFSSNGTQYYTSNYWQCWYNNTNTDHQDYNHTQNYNHTYYRNQTQQNNSLPVNQTNSTINSTVNSTNSTSLLNNSFINGTQAEQQTAEIQKFQHFMKGILGNQALMLGNLVPGSRKILQPLFSFFVNIDDLWLYNYHEREYDFVVTSVFYSVQQLQNQKWTLLQFQKIQSIFELNSNVTIQQFSSKYNYSSWKFIQVQQNSNGFILNTLNFFCSNVLFMFIIFIILRVLFFRLFNYRISILFRQYSFWFYFILMVLDGNVQYLTFLFSFQMKNFFSVNIINKIGLCIAVLLYFTIFIFAVAAFPIIKNQYGRLANYFTQNLRVCTASFIYLTFQTGYRNVLLGFLHIMLDSIYYLKLGTLIFTEIGFLIFTVILLTKQKIFTNHIKCWLNIIATLLRILIIFTFFLDKNNIHTVIQNVHIVIFYLYFLQMFMAISIQIIRMTIEAIIFIKNQNSPQQQLIIESQQDKQQIQKLKKKNKKILKKKFLKQELPQNKKIQSKQFLQTNIDQHLNFIQNRQNVVKHIRFNLPNQQQQVKVKSKTLKPRLKTHFGLKNRLKIRMISQNACKANTKSDSNMHQIKGD